MDERKMIIGKRLCNEDIIENIKKVEDKQTTRPKKEEEKDVDRNEKQEENVRNNKSTRRLNQKQELDGTRISRRLVNIHTQLRASNGGC